jgi:hypothetical protein
LPRLKNYSESCDKIDNSYTPEQNTRLFKSATPLISSLAETYQQLIDHKEKVLNVYKIGDFISRYSEPINETLDKFITWQALHGSEDVDDITKDEVVESKKLIENRNEIYGH